ncbi:MAG: sarcosine oxidase subunit delta [Gammaproteobacteria bacterium]|nr:sarcosine oxidase subunit delta [Gammaproteobacteria bacterium]
MMQLPCPWCGVRDESEFVCGGASHIVRPGLSASDAEWGSYLFFRDNPKGPLRERWRHAYGCGQWFNLMRDTLTHQVLSVYPMAEPPPAGG